MLMIEISSERLRVHSKPVAVVITMLSWEIPGLSRGWALRTRSASSSRRQPSLVVTSDPNAMRPAGI
jgi:hypothetical protein